MSRSRSQFNKRVHVELSQRLRYQFKDQSLLLAALSHRSATDESNERMEYLGDAVLNAVIASTLYKICPTAQEGELSRLRANLVKGETLANIAQEFEIGQYLRLGIGELKSGGAQRKSILADALEAIIGAIYLDSGFETCENLILDWYGSRLQEVKKQKVHPKDAKTLLQEYLQARKQTLPSYKVVNVEGAMHEQIFTVECQVSNIPYHALGSGSSRRKAEQVAAAEYFELIQRQMKLSKKQRSKQSSRDD